MHLKHTLGYRIAAARVATNTDPKYARSSHASPFPCQRETLVTAHRADAFYPAFHYYCCRWELARRG